MIKNLSKVLFVQHNISYWNLFIVLHFLLEKKNLFFGLKKFTLCLSSVNNKPALFIIKLKFHYIDISLLYVSYIMWFLCQNGGKKREREREKWEPFDMMREKRVKLIYNNDDGKIPSRFTRCYRKEFRGRRNYWWKLNWKLLPGFGGYVFWNINSIHLFSLLKHEEIEVKTKKFWVALKPKVYFRGFLGVKKLNQRLFMFMMFFCFDWGNALLPRGKAQTGRSR